MDEKVKRIITENQELIKQIFLHTDGEKYINIYPDEIEIRGYVDVIDRNIFGAITIPKRSTYKICDLDLILSNYQSAKYYEERWKKVSELMINTIKANKQLVYDHFLMDGFTIFFGENYEKYRFSDTLPKDNDLVYMHNHRWKSFNFNRDNLEKEILKYLHNRFHIRPIARWEESDSRNW